MIKENFTSLPDFIKEKYKQQNNVSQPIDILEHIVLTGQKFGASDVHITGVLYDEQSFDNLANIKFRIDGKLDNHIYNLSEEVRNNPKSYITMGNFAEFMRGVKTIISLKYMETEIPQDAAHSFEHFEDNKKVGETKVRISCMPLGIPIKKSGEVGYHESLVLRIINDSVDSLPKYEDLGIMPVDLKKLNTFLKSEKGALITSGPTGSGKSVTLQVLLSQIASEEKKIHTLEDPIEYRNPLLIQSQISISKGFDWLRGLKALMRQDPDIIMIGEMRDEESAELFIESSLTGHMGFSTTHAKTGCGAFDRLKLMGVKPYLIVGGVSISMSQRLNQKLCPSCKENISDPVVQEKLAFIFKDKFEKFDFSTLSVEDICFMLGDSSEETIASINKIFSNFQALKKLIQENKDSSEVILAKQKFLNLNQKVYQALKQHFINNSFQRKKIEQGEKLRCDKCAGKGVKGRVGVFEFIETTKEIEQLVLEDTPLKHMEDFVRNNNILTLDRYGIIRMMRGEIDLEELVKLI